MKFSVLKEFCWFRYSLVVLAQSQLARPFPRH